MRCVVCHVRHHKVNDVKSPLVVIRIILTELNLWHDFPPASCSNFLFARCCVVSFFCNKHLIANVFTVQHNIVNNFVDRHTSWHNKFVRLGVFSNAVTRAFAIAVGHSCATHSRIIVSYDTFSSQKLIVKLYLYISNVLNNF